MVTSAIVGLQYPLLRWPIPNARKYAEEITRSCVVETGDYLSMVLQVRLVQVLAPDPLLLRLLDGDREVGSKRSLCDQFDCTVRYSMDAFWVYSVYMYGYCLLMLCLTFSAIVYNCTTINRRLPC